MIDWVMGSLLPLLSFYLPCFKTYMACRGKGQVPRVLKYWVLLVLLRALYPLIWLIVAESFQALLQLALLAALYWDDCELAVQVYDASVDSLFTANRDRLEGWAYSVEEWCRAQSSTLHDQALNGLF
jgi:hypothetical protein